jgi:hypothetical protein
MEQLFRWFVRRPETITSFSGLNGGLGLARDPSTVTPDQRLVLRAALDEPERALCCFGEWWKRVDIKHTGTTEYRLLPLVYHNIGRLIPDKVAAARVKGVAKHVWLSNYRNAALGAYVLDTLTLANVPTVILKGAAMMAAVCTENMRSMGDCDILVPVERASQALAALAEVDLHAQFPFRHFGAADYKRYHGLSLRRPSEQAYHLDLQWRPFRNVGADELTNEFFDSAVSCEFSRRKTRRPSFEHMLLHAAVHGTEWAAVPRYDWLADAALILRAAGAAFDWDRLADTAGRYRLGSITRAALNELARTLDIPIPAPALRRLSKGRAIDRAETCWRAMDPARVPLLGRRIMTLQTLRREDARLARRSVLAVVPKTWRSVFGPPPPAVMQPAIAWDAEDHIMYLSGWQHLEYLEPAGRWTDGSLAVLAIQRAPGRKGDFLRLAGYMIQAQYGSQQVVDVYSGWRHLARLIWPPHTYRADVIPLPQSLRSREIFMLQLRIRTPVAPADTGLNDDTRQLGFFLQDIRSTSCVRDATARALNLHHGSSDLAVLWSGWSHPEPEGCWTDGPDALLRWFSPRDLPDDARLIIRAIGFVPGGEALRGFISINGRRARDLTPVDFESGPTDLWVPLGSAPGDREISVHIHIDNPRSPRAAGISPDDRKLGLFVQSVGIKVDGRIGRSAVGPI